LLRRWERRKIQLPETRLERSPDGAGSYRI
jgi:hypothetical protein